MNDFVGINDFTNHATIALRMLVAFHMLLSFACGFIAGRSGRK